jgi:hypothetical protein
MFRLRSIGVLSCAKIFTVIQGAIGILFGFLFLIFGLIGAAVSPGRQKFGMIGIIVIAVLMPLFYAAIGFVIGAIWAAVYNLAAQSIGGLELQLESAPVMVMSPPPQPPPAVPFAEA